MLLWFSRWTNLSVGQLQPRRRTKHHHSNNTTLTELSSGSHNVTISANDMYGNMVTSETVAFNVSEPEVAEPFPTTTVAAVSGAIVLIVVAGLLVYLKKHRRAV